MVAAHSHEGRCCGQFFCAQRLSGQELPVPKAGGPVSFFTFFSFLAPFRANMVSADASYRVDDLWARRMMASRAAIQELLWTGAVGQCADASQRWVLRAMRKHGPGLVSMLWRILGNEQDVCDVYQQTFLKLAHPDRGRRPRNVVGYLYRTAANEAVTLLRRSALRRRAHDELVASRPVSTTVEYGAELDNRQLQADLRRALGLLPDHLRNVVLLRDLAELSYSEVGRLLDITPATARVYRCKAVAWLSRIMRENSNSAP